MTDREERFQMRQRGAGARDVDDVSLNIGGFSSDRPDTPDDVSLRAAPVRQPVILDNAQREQKFLMRQRGAGARDVDFTLNLGIPPVSSPSGRLSVAGSTISTNSGTRPASSNASPTIARSSLRRSYVAPVAQMTAENEDGTARKRQRISPENEPFEEYDAGLGDDNDLQDIPEEEPLPDPEVVAANSPRASSTSSTRRRRKKKSILPKSKRRKAASTGSVGTSSITGDEEDSTARTFNPGPVRQALAQPKNPRQSIQRAQEDSPQEEESAEKDDTVIGVDARAQAGDASVTRTEQPRFYGIFNQTSQPNTAATVKAIQRIQQEHGISNKENQPSRNASKPKVTSRPAKTKKGRKKQPTKSKKRQGSSGREENNSEVVVTVRRVAHISRLDFITEEDDELAAEQLSTFRQKRSPNAVDVLAQICREIIDKRIKASASNERDTSSSNNSERKRKRDSLRQFGEELDSRLLMMTTALDHHNSLNSKLRNAVKQKGQHRSTLLELRAQRSAIELQQDAIRSANEQASKSSNDRFELNSHLADIELAVQRGREGQGDGDGGSDAGSNSAASDTLSRQGTLSMRLQRVSEVVSSAQGRVGLLERVRTFNALLEGMVRDG